MFSRQAMRGLRGMRHLQLRRATPPAHSVLLPVMMQLRRYADYVVKVPQMAESITEGTLAEWTKKVGDFIEQDEELASIETDKVGFPRLAPLPFSRPRR